MMINVWSEDGYKTSHLEEVRAMVDCVFGEGRVLVSGDSLTVSQVALVARYPGKACVVLDAAQKSPVEDCAAWVKESTKNGIDTYAITTGFGAHSSRRTRKLKELQTELIRYLNAGVIGKDLGNEMSVPTVRSTMLVRINCLVQGYSGIRWEILDGIARLLNADITPRVPLRGSISASGDLMPLAYIAGVLTGRPDSTARKGGDEVSSKQALELAGIATPFELHPKEGIAMVNGTAACSGLASLVCFDANVMVVFAEVLSAMFCEALHGRVEFTHPLVHKLKHHPGQIEAASVMEHILSDSPFMKVAAQLNEVDSLRKLKQDRYALRSSPQWLGPQIEVIRQATRTIHREINSVNDNPIIDMSGSKALQSGNFQATPVAAAMDNVRIALAAIGRLFFAQFTELVNAGFNNGLPSNLSAAADPCLDFGFHGAEIAMASYISELEYLANPVTTHVQSAEHHNQAINSLGLISARKTEEALDVLKLMLSTYLLALCQAIDLRQLELHLREVVKETVSSVASNFFSSSYVHDCMIHETDKLYVFSYVYDPMDKSSSLRQKLGEVFLSNSAMQSENSLQVTTFQAFTDELKSKLDEAIARAWEKMDMTIHTDHIVKSCAIYPLYECVRGLLCTKLLTGGGMGMGTAPKEYLDKLYDAFQDGTLVCALFKCL